jgi:hypothetical protein
MEDLAMEGPIRFDTAEELRHCWAAKALLTSRLVALGLPVPDWLRGEQWEGGGDVENN